MATGRKFCRFPGISSKGELLVTGALPVSEVPEGGLCLSAFLVLYENKSPSKILMGIVNPAAPWDHIGAISGPIIERSHDKWMLPSSHLQIHESPTEAAGRILKEQLGVDETAISLSKPEVFSDVYDSWTGSKGHWDMGFVFKGNVSDPSALKMAENKNWKKLDFVDLASIPKYQFARAHNDVLSYAGILR
jgi:ADP-ribose pyrophosphatase YjhB (NUDIX family)